MTQVLIAPIHVDALLISCSTVVREALADYTRLPFARGTGDSNSGIPYLGESILSHPFQDQNLVLAPGVHLHWSLPQGLRKTVGLHVVQRQDLEPLRPYIKDERGNEWQRVRGILWKLLAESGWIKPFGDAGKASLMGDRPAKEQVFEEGLYQFRNALQAKDMEAAFRADLARILNRPLGSNFPAVPDMWVVTRKAADGKAQRTWIVESGYIAAAQSEASGNPQAVNVPFHDDRPDNESQPFRFMGRRLAGTETWSSGGRNDTDYIAEVTAVGYNSQEGSKGFAEPTFAAFYPNCRSVFGFHDPEVTEPTNGISYEVIGFYANPEGDYLRILLEDLRIRNAGPADPAAIQKLLLDELNYRIAEGDLPADGAPFPRMSALFGRTIPKAPGDPNPSNVRVAVGTTGTEALSAYVASRLEGAAGVTGTRKQIEELLEATQFAARLQNKTLDIGYKFQEARHAKGFSGFDGGDIWTIKLESVAARPAADAETGEPEFRLPEDVAFLLNEANSLQAAYDRGNRQLYALRSQLYADWYKYMLCAYPPLEEVRDRPSADELIEYVRSGGIAPLQAAQAAQGTMSTRKDDTGRLVAATSTAPDATAGARLARKLQQLLDRIEALNQAPGARGTSWADGGKYLALRPVAAARFWRPNDPSVLFLEEEAAAGEAVLTDDRFARTDDPALLDCRIVACELRDPAAVSFAEAVGLLNASSAAFPDGSQTGNAVATSIWNPFLMEWSVAYEPALAGSNMETHDRHYDDQYVRRHYKLPETAPDFGTPPHTDAFGHESLHQGSTLLTPHAGIGLAAAIAGFTDDANGRQSSETKETLKAAAAFLKTCNVLSQSLGGFHEALLLKKQTRQLDVADPIGFKPYQKFTHEEVAPLVGKANNTAPDVLGDFTPVRCGLLRLLRLRLIDSYGRVLELAGPPSVNSETLRLDTAPQVIHLPPRLAQPARLNFRFLSAAAGQQEMNLHPAASPVCGWLLPNTLDGSLMVYDSDGAAVGSLGPNADAPWTPAPDSAATGFIDTIGNPHLRAVVRRLFDLQHASVREGAGQTPFLPDFLKALDTALDTIQPEAFAEHQELAVLLGRPIAVVRAKLGFELYGPAHTDQSWASLNRELEDGVRATDGFMQVQVPIRLGEYQQRNDGLVGYWREGADGVLEDVYYSSEAGNVAHPGIQSYTVGGEALNIFRAIDDDPLALTLLVDPLGSVHASCGILPVKSIAIPKDQYRDALKRIAVTFLTAPVLSLVGHLKLSLPQEPGYQWTWLEQGTPGRWMEIPQTVRVSRAVFDAKFPDQPQLWQRLVDDKWLQPLPGDAATAWVTAAVRRAFPPGEHPEANPLPTDVGKRLDAFFDQYATRIEPFELHADFGGTPVLREGWLQLDAD